MHRRRRQNQRRRDELPCEVQARGTARPRYLDRMPTRARAAPLVGEMSVFATASLHGRRVVYAPHGSDAAVAPPTQAQLEEYVKLTGARVSMPHARARTPHAPAVRTHAHAPRRTQSPGCALILCASRCLPARVRRPKHDHLFRKREAASDQRVRAGQRLRPLRVRAIHLDAAHAVLRGRQTAPRPRDAASLVEDHRGRAWAFKAVALCELALPFCAGVLRAPPTAATA